MGWARLATHRFADNAREAWRVNLLSKERKIQKGSQGGRGGSRAFASSNTTRTFLLFVRKITTPVSYTLERKKLVLSNLRRGQTPHHQHMNIIVTSLLRRILPVALAAASTLPAFIYSPVSGSAVPPFDPPSNAHTPDE